MNIAPLSNVAPLKPKLKRKPVERPLSVHPLTAGMMLRYALFAVELAIAGLVVPLVALVWGIPRGIGVTLRDGCLVAWAELDAARRRCGR